MKKIIVLMSILATVYCSAQVSIFTKVGSTLSMPETNESRTKNKLYANFGAGVGYRFSKPFELTLGVDYLVTGAKDAGLVIDDYQFNQIQIPLVVNIYLTDAFYLSAGGYYSSVLSMKVDGEDVDGTYYDDYSKSDYGAIVGLGVEYKSFFLESRYNMGFNNIVDLSAYFDPVFDPIVDTYPKYKQRFLTLCVGYKF